jgi:hypothetical protein
VTVATDSAPDVAKPPAPNVVSPDFVPGLSGVVAFTTEIAEPDRHGGALRYRGVNVENRSPRGSNSVTSGRYSWTASSATACHRRSRTSCRYTPAMFGSTCRPDWPCCRRRGAIRTRRLHTRSAAVDDR